MKAQYMSVYNACQVVAPSRLSPDLQTVRAKKREISVRYAHDKKNKSRRRGWWNTRKGALTKVFGSQRRYGGGKLYQFTDDDAGREDLRILLDHYALSNPAALTRVIKARAPWLSKPERDSLMEHVGASPRYWDSPSLADALRLTEAERNALGCVPTIGAIDVTPAERKAAQQQRDYAWKKAKRRNDGVVDRAEWLAANNVSRCKPWDNEGISRAQWYRRRHETGESGVTLVSTSDRPVSQSEPSHSDVALQSANVVSFAKPNQNPTPATQQPWRNAA
jgi:hypothetical protein